MDRSGEHETRPGKRLQFAIEHGDYLVDFPMKHGDFPSLCESLPEDKCH